MGSSENKLNGKVIGHTVKFLPKKIDHRGAGITITKAEKIGAFVTIQVDDKRTYLIPSRETEMILEDQKPTPETKTTVYNALLEKHPFNSERTFNEFITTKNKGTVLRRYELEE